MRRPAEMPTVSISTLTLTMVTSDRDGRLRDLKWMFEDAFGPS